MDKPSELPVRLLTLDSGILCIEMRDAAGRNSFSPGFVSELQGCLAKVCADPDAKVLVLLGLDDVFASGATQELLLQLAQGELAASDITLTKAMLDIPIPTIAAMAGHAAGGGLALGFAADMIILAKESRYGASFMNMGFTPGMGMTRLLEHCLSPAVAHELLYSGEYRRGAELAKHGGINHVLPKAQVNAKALDLATHIAEKPRYALELLKRTLIMPRRLAFEQSYTMECLMHRISFAQPELIERIHNDYLK